MLATTVPDSPALTCPCFLLQQAVSHPTLPVLAGECPPRRVLKPNSWSGHGRWMGEQGHSGEGWEKVRPGLVPEKGKLEYLLPPWLPR